MRRAHDGVASCSSQHDLHFATGCTCQPAGPGEQVHDIVGDTDPQAVTDRARSSAETPRARRQQQQPTPPAVRPSPRRTRAPPSHRPTASAQHESNCCGARRHARRTAPTPPIRASTTAEPLARAASPRPGSRSLGPHPVAPLRRGVDTSAAGSPRHDRRRGGFGPDRGIATIRAVSTHFGRGPRANCDEVGLAPSAVSRAVKRGSSSSMGAGLRLRSRRYCPNLPRCDRTQGLSGGPASA
jgi:hypothetical protein